MSIKINTYEKADAIKYIFSKCPTINQNFDLGVTLTDIVLKMEDPKNIEKVITLFKLYYKENEIIRLINKSDEQINKMYALMYHGIKTKSVIEIICLPDEDIPYAFDLLFKYQITDSDLSTVLANKVDNMFKRMTRICEKIKEDDTNHFIRIHIMTVYQMVKDSNDTDDIIMKTLSLIKNGIDSIDAYYASIKF
jgi:hypothetical protein